MKLVLSRKGFDSSAGGCASPLLPDGRMISLPIPDRNSIVTYGDIRRSGQSLGPIVELLTGGRILQKYRAHLDPDLVEDSLPRRAGWRPIFGQSNQAQTHLRKNGVGPGDLFLFFGRFGRTRMVEGKLAWEPGQRPRHVVWGWLQVDEVLSPNQVDTERYGWARDHPHFHRGEDPHNTIYIARQRLDLGPGFRANIPGAGVLHHFQPSLQLTAHKARNVTDWSLPGWFFPSADRTPLTYHAAPDRWERCNGRTKLRAAARGQEFVLDCAEYPEAMEWLVELLCAAADSSDAR